MGAGDYGIDTEVIARDGRRGAELRQLGVEVGMVLGRRNLFRGAGLARAGMDRVLPITWACWPRSCELAGHAGHSGALGVFTRVMSAIRINRLRGLHPPPRHPPSGKRTGSHLRCRYWQHPSSPPIPPPACERLEISGPMSCSRPTKVDGVYSAIPSRIPGGALCRLTYDELWRANCRSWTPRLLSCAANMTCH